MLGLGLLQAPQNVFAEYDTHVHNGAHRDGDPGQSHDIRSDTEPFHGDEAQKHGQRQHGAYKEAAAQVHQHHENDQHRNQNLQRDRLAQRAQGLVD